jgi:DNA-binding response OmpR family regulator
VEWRGGVRDLSETLAPGGCPIPGAAGTRLARVSAADRPDAPATVLVYSHRPDVRQAVRTAVGRRPASDVGPLAWVEAETGDQVISAVELGGIDLCILDGEAQPTGGLALSRQLNEELADRPPVCVLIARQPDRWLAHWSMADGTLPFPIDPLTAPRIVADLLRQHSAGRPVARS